MLHTRHGVLMGVGFALLSCGEPTDPAPTFIPEANAPLLGPPAISAAAGAGARGSRSGTIPLFNLDEPPPANSDELAPGNACAGIIHEGERLPLDMYFLVDLSGSMAEPVQSGSKWDLVSQALTSFLREPRNADIGMGIGYFPTGASPTCVQGDAGCLCIPFVNLCLANLGGSCVVADYAVPAVPLSLPPNPGAVINDLLARSLAGGTPTRPALEGTFEYVNSWASENPGRRAVVVLATDGDPTGCLPNAPADVAALAQAALEGPNRIQTFVIGVGRSLTNLNLVARAGGTTQAFLTDTSGNLVQQLADTLARIRNQAGPCSFDIAGQGSGKIIDPDRVNVRYLVPGATQPTVVAKTYAGTADHCGTEGGWYYDDAAAPSQIRLCEATCEAARGARLEVEFGCKTIVASPR